MPKFRKKPVVIDATQFKIDESAPSSPQFMEYAVEWDAKGPYLIIPTLEGNHRADNGDWIITGVKGERYPCKDDVFRLTYEAAE